jgi:hypothetical protein
MNNNRHDASTYQVLQPSLAVYVSPALISMPLTTQVAGSSDEGQAILLHVAAPLSLHRHVLHPSPDRKTSPAQ